MIAATELTHNYEHLNTPYDSNQLTETLFQKIQDARVCGGGWPTLWRCDDCKYFFNTRFFPDACRMWHEKTVAEKTWTQFKLDFT
jgi:hypothetical protein